MFSVQVNRMVVHVLATCGTEKPEQTCSALRQPYGSDTNMNSRVHKGQSIRPMFPYVQHWCKI